MSEQRFRALVEVFLDNLENVSPRHCNQALREAWNALMPVVNKFVPEPNTIYIAGSSDERKAIQQLMMAAREYGYEVTYDWTVNEGFDKPDEEVTDQECQLNAVDDFEAVKRASIFWYVTPENGKSEGVATELGMALAFQKTVIVSGPLGRHRIFPRCAHHRFMLHAEALEFLRVRARVEEEL